jgi:xylulokinase
VTAVGGGSRSELWLRIIATVLNIRVDIPADGDFGGAFGAARLGLIAATGATVVSVCKPPKTAKTISPNAKLRGPYEETYHRYAKLYDATREINRP